MIIALTMWTATIILGIADFKTESTRWVMRLAFFAGLAGFSMFWSDNTALLVKYFGLTDETHEIVRTIISALSHYFIPYCALMFGLSYSEVLAPKHKKIFSALLLIPMLVTFLFYPTHDYGFKTSSQFIPYYRLFSIWAVPYAMIGCILQIYAYVKEDILGRKRERLIFCLIAVPGIAITSVTTYLLAGLPYNQPWNYWRYNVFVILYMFILFLYFLIKYGVLGIKVRVEKQNRRNMMNVLNSGMKILSHSLKNEITKISICMTNIQHSLAQPDRDINDVNENIQMVSTSLTYLSNIVKELQRNSLNPGNLKLLPSNLGEMVETALESVTVFLKAKNIRVTKDVNPEVSIICDKVYMQEVFVNICQNAIEAMGAEGSLEIETTLTSKGLIIVFKDNGTGIAREDLPHVMEPFFTTKDKKLNLGLGLAYCYNMLKKHGASLEIQSERNTGTTINIFFPKNKVVLN